MRPSVRISVQSGCVNYLDQDETGDPAAAAYRSELRPAAPMSEKEIPIPENPCFHINVNIKPR